MMEGNFALPAAVCAERMNVAVATVTPAIEFDAEFEGRACGGHELGLVDPEPLVKPADVGQGGLADTDDSDRFRFDEVHSALTRQQLHERSGGHPAGGAPADDNNADLFGFAHDRNAPYARMQPTDIC